MKELGLFTLEKTQRHHRDFPVLKGQELRGWRLFFHGESHGEDKGQ